jgi:hypothetical protein
LISIITPDDMPATPRRRDTGRPQCAADDDIAPV